MVLIQTSKIDAGILFLYMPRAVVVNILELLLKYGADTTITNNKGQVAYDCIDANDTKTRELMFEYSMLPDRCMEDSINRIMYTKSIHKL